MEFLTYLAKVSLFTILFYGFYVLLIRRTTFFRLNRAYLILSLILSFLLPLITLEERVSIKVEEQAAQADFAGDNAAYDIAPVDLAPAPAGKDMITSLLLAAYICGALVFLGMFLYRLSLVIRLVRSYPETTYDDDLPVVVMTGSHLRTGSFSFFNRIFISQTDFDHHFDTVYSHEKAHVTQRHSLDILLVELFRVVFWFNPVLQLYKHSLQEVHEFLADTSATDKESYARFLVAYAMSGDYPPTITNSFFNSLSLKKRIEMLYKKPDPGYALTRYLLIIPIAALLVTLTASRHYVYTYEKEPLPPVPKSDKVISEKATDTADNTPNSPVESLPAEARVPVLVTYERESSPTTQKDDRVISGRVTDAADNTPLPGAAVLVKGLTVGTTTDSDGFYSLTVPSGSHELYVSFVGFIPQSLTLRDKDRIDIALSRSRNQLDELVVIGYGPVKGTRQQGDTVPSKPTGEFRVVEQMPEFPGGIAELRRYLSKNIRYPGEAARANIQGRVYVSFMINKLGDIRNPRVLQGLGHGIDEEALRIVISMPRWTPGKQNGAPVDVEYTLPINFKLDLPEENKQGYVPQQGTIIRNSDETRNTGTRIQIRGAEAQSVAGHLFSPYELTEIIDQPRMKFPRGEDAPLYLVDGKELYSLDGLKPDTIASLTVLKRGNLVSEYGPRAKNGVILITLKK